MKYDPIKDQLFSLVRLFPTFRALFYKMLDFLLLRQRYVKREIRRYFHDGDSFYDAGAGFCQYSDFVLKRYPKSRVFATDLKTDYLSSYASLAGKRFSFKTADLQNYEPQNKFDLAIAIDILEHIEDDCAAITNLYNTLKDGAHLIISTPSNLDEAARYAEEHVRPGYDKEELEAKLIACGFEIISSRYSYGAFGALAWKLQMQIPLAMLDATKFNALVLLLWYPMFMPLMEFLVRLDMMKQNRRGNGIILVARKRL